MLLSEAKLFFIVGVAMIAVLSLLGFIFFVIYKNIKIRQEKEMEIRDAVIETQNNEQNRIAEDLHDELAPLLSAIKLQLNNMKGLTEENITSIEICSGRLDKSIEDIRLISRKLSGKMIANNGLVPSIEDSLSLFGRQTKVKFETFFNINETQLHDNVKSNLYKILMELVNNSIRHSNSTSISINIFNEGSTLRFKYSDNGKTHQTTENKKGLGSTNITNRLGMIHGKINLSTDQFANGANYDFSIPLNI